MTLAKNDNVVWKPHPGKQTFALKRTEFEVLYGGARGGGKDVDLNTSILTKHGWKKAKNITFNDKLITPTGEATKIIGIYPKRNRKMYRMTFIDNREVVCDEEHNWLVYSKDHGHRDGWLMRNTKTLFDNPTNWSVPLVETIGGKQWKGANPYIAGYILGDGTLTSDKEIVYTVDEEVINYLISNGWSRYDYSYQNTTMCMPKGKERGIYQDVLGKVSGENKEVPKMLLESDYNTRLSLLQGLMDSDGHCDKEGRASFCNKSLKLCKNVQYLVRSLGGKAKISKVDRGRRRIRQYYSDGKYYKVSVSYIGKFKPFRLSRKSVRLNMNQCNNKLGIKSIVRVGSRDGVCFKIEHPSRLFVVQDFIVTHNSDAGLAWLLYEKDDPAFRALVIRRNAEDLNDWIDRARYLYSYVGGRVAGRPAVITFPSGATIRTGHLKDEGAYTKYQGHEYHKMLIEELTLIPTEKLYMQLISSCRSTVPRLKPQIFATTNPGNVGHIWVKKRFVDPAPPMTPIYDRVSRRHRIFVPATIDDNPTLVDNDPTYVNFLESLEEVDEELYKAWRLGDWDTFAGQFFREFRRDLHTCKSFTPKESILKVGGIDWGRKAPFVFLGGVFEKVKLQDGRQFRRIWIYQEIDGTEKTPADWAEIINERVNLNEYDEIRCDPSMFTKGNDGSISIAEQFQNALPEHMSLFRPASNDRIGGWENVHKWLSIAPDNLPYLIIAENCHNLITTLPGLVHDEKRVEDVDTDSDDHHADALRYLLKHVRWIDGRAGGVKEKSRFNPYSHIRIKPAANQPIDVREFEKTEKRKRDWKYK